jgi:lysophospholipase L1-like esterase
MNWETLLCFGDSITFGARSYLGYPEICGNILENELNKKWNVINHSMNGYRAIDLVRYIDGNSSNLQIVYPSIITLMIGTNDVKIGTSIEDFEIAYELLLTKLKLLAVNNNILVLKLPQFTNKVFYPYTYEMNETVIVYNELIEKIAIRNGVRRFQFEFNDSDFFDGVHLNVLGSKSAAKQLSSFILKDKGIESTSALS